MSSSIVIDASIAAPWVLPDERTVFSDRLFAQVCTDFGRYHAPALWIWEVGNLLVSAVRRKRLSRDDAQLGLEQFKLCQIQTAPLPTPHKQSQILRLAIAHDLSFYDATYLELVLSLNGQLASTDAKLVQAAKACGVICLDI